MNKIDFETREGVAKAVFAKLLHVQTGAWLAPPGYGFSQPQHEWRDYINVVVGRYKYSANCHTIKGAAAVAKRAFPMTNAAQTADRVIREHAVPSLVLWQIAEEATRWQDCLEIINLFTVVILTKEQDRKIKYTSQMPPSWKRTGSVFARYEGLDFYDELVASAKAHPIEHQV